MVVEEARGERCGRGHACNATRAAVVGVALFVVWAGLRTQLHLLLQGNALRHV